MKNWKWSKKATIIVGILLFLVLIRLLLPGIVLRYANNTLANLSGYHGQIEDINIFLYRGAYQIDHFYLNKVDSATGEQTEFLRADRIDLSVEWGALLKGALVGELVFDAPKLIFTKDKAEIDEVAKDTSDFRELLKDFMPLKVNRFEIRRGSIHYSDSTASPVVNLALEEAYILAENLTNSDDTGEKLPSRVQANAHVYGGTIHLEMELDPLAKHPTFDLTAEIDGANLPALNDFFIAYGKFDISQGTFGLYTEFAADEGKYKGYVKPIIKDLEVVGTEDREDSFFQRAKEAVIDVISSILENPQEEQVASRVPIEGTFENTDILAWEAVWQLLKNAFIEALMPSVDHAIDIQSPQEVGRESIFDPS